MASTTPSLIYRAAAAAAIFLLFGGTRECAPSSSSPSGPVRQTTRTSPPPIFAAGFNNSWSTVQSGSEAVLDCRLNRAPTTSDGGGEEVLMWSRQTSPGSFSLLALDGEVHSQDPRLWTGGTEREEAKRASQRETNWNWPLVIRAVRPSDSGLYRCHTSSHPPQFVVHTLRVIEAVAQIRGPRERFVKSGSRLEVVCDFVNHTAPPTAVFWYMNDTMVSFSPWFSVRTSANWTRLRLGGRAGGARREFHSGNLTCAPSPLAPDSVVIRVVNELDPRGRAVAASRAESSTRPELSQMMLLICSVTLLIS